MHCVLLLGTLLNQSQREGPGWWLVVVTGGGVVDPRLSRGSPWPCGLCNGRGAWVNGHYSWWSGAWHGPWLGTAGGRQ